MKKRPEDMKRDLNDILNTVHMKTDLDSREETCEQEKETEIYKKKYVDMKWKLEIYIQLSTRVVVDNIIWVAEKGEKETEIYEKKYVDMKWKLDYSCRPVSL